MSVRRSRWVSQHPDRVSQSPRPCREIIGLRPFSGMVAHAIAARNENHSSWANVVKLSRIVSGGRINVLMRNPDLVGDFRDQGTNARIKIKRGRMLDLLDFDTARSAQLLDDLADLAVDAIDDRIVGMTKVDREENLGWHDRGGVWRHIEKADGQFGVGRSHRRLVDHGDHPHRRHQRILALVSFSGPGMRRRAVNANAVAAGPQYSGDTSHLPRRTV